MAADYDPVGDAAGSNDRYVAPDLKDYAQVYRIGHDLLLPTAIGGEKASGPGAEKIKLFVPDDVNGFTSIGRKAAEEVTKVSQQFGNPNAFDADDVSFNFVKVAQKLKGVPVADTSMASTMDGTEISGFLGNNTLTLLTLHIDYRDGLLKADYVPGRGYKFDDNSSHP